MTDAKVRVQEVVDSLRGELVEVSHWIHAHPEIAWQEHESSAYLAQFLEGHGFTVEHNFVGLATAFKATYGTGDLTIALCAEYDALPGLGHACGHNIIASASVGAALALKEVASQLDATIVVFGTPAEEGSGGKIAMLSQNAFAGVDVAALIHPGPVDVDHGNPFAVKHIDVAYTGKASHAAAYPEHGINAADAFTIAQVAIGLLRQQLSPTVRVHGIVTRGGEVANAIPERTEGRWYVRANTLAELDDIYQRVVKCFEAGALATGCTLHIEDDLNPYSEFTNHTELTSRYRANAESLGRRFDAPEPATRMNRASTDMGNVSAVVASFHPYIGINSGTAVNHQHQFAAASITPDADQAVVDGAKGLAMTMVDVATDSALRNYVMTFSR
ncbi:MAG: M20 family metallopeptidase [Actinomycetes bacterium]